MNTTTATEDRDIFVLLGELGVVYKLCMIPWRELSSNGVLDSEAVLLILAESGLRKPSWSINLEWIRVLAWREVLAFGELDYDLLNRDDLFHLLVVILERDCSIRCQVTTFNTF